MSAVVAASVLVILVSVVAFFTARGVENSVTALRCRNKIGAIGFASPGDFVVVDPFAAITSLAPLMLNNAVAAGWQLTIDAIVIGVVVAVIAGFAGIDVAVTAMGEINEGAGCHITGLVFGQRCPAFAFFARIKVTIAAVRELDDLALVATFVFPGGSIALLPGIDRVITAADIPFIDLAVTVVV